MWQGRLTKSSLHAAHDNGRAGGGVHAEALLAQYLARHRRSRRGQKVRLARCLATLAVSHATLSGQDSALRRRSQTHVHKKSVRPVMSPSRSSSNNSFRCQPVISQWPQHMTSDRGHFVMHNSTLSHSLASSPNSSSSLSLSAAPSLGRHGPVNAPQILPSDLSRSSASLLSGSSSHIKQQALVGQPSSLPTGSSKKERKEKCAPLGVITGASVPRSSSRGSSNSDTPALQSVGLGSSARPDGRGPGVQQTSVYAGDTSLGCRSDGWASETPRHRLSKCTRAADLPLKAEDPVSEEMANFDDGASSSSFARPWLRSVSLNSKTLKAGAVQEAGRLIRRVSAGDLAVKASTMTAEAKKKSSAWLRSKKESWSIPAHSLQNPGTCDRVSLILQKILCICAKAISIAL